MNTYKHIIAALILLNTLFLEPASAGKDEYVLHIKSSQAIVNKAKNKIEADEFIAVYLDFAKDFKAINNSGLEDGNTLNLHRDILKLLVEKAIDSVDLEVLLNKYLKFVKSFNDEHECDINGWAMALTPLKEQLAHATDTVNLKAFWGEEYLTSVLIAIENKKGLDEFKNSLPKAVDFEEEIKSDCDLKAEEITNESFSPSQRLQNLLNFDDPKKGSKHSTDSLLYASKRGDGFHLKFYLVLGADTQFEQNGFRAIDWAVKNGKVACYKILSQIEFAGLSKVKNKRINRLFQSLCLMKRDKNISKEIYEDYYDNYGGKINLNWENSEGHTTLAELAAGNQYKTEGNAQHVDKGYSECTEWLIKKGADVEAGDYPPLWFAVYARNSWFVSILMGNESLGLTSLTSLMKLTNKKNRSAIAGNSLLGDSIKSKSILKQLLVLILNIKINNISDTGEKENLTISFKKEIERLRSEITHPPLDKNEQFHSHCTSGKIKKAIDFYNLHNKQIDLDWKNKIGLTTLGALANTNVPSDKKNVEIAEWLIGLNKKGRRANVEEGTPTPLWLAVYSRNILFIRKVILPNRKVGKRSLFSLVGNIIEGKFAGKDAFIGDPNENISINNKRDLLENFRSNFSL